MDRTKMLAIVGVIGIGLLAMAPSNAQMIYDHEGRYTTGFVNDWNTGAAVIDESDEWDAYAYNVGPAVGAQVTTPYTPPIEQRFARPAECMDNEGRYNNCFK